MVGLTAIAGALTVSLAVAPGRDAAVMRAAECTRPAPRTFAEGETVVLSEATKFPCRLEFANTPIALKAEGVDAVVDIDMVQRGPDGQFYSSARKAAAISIWSPQGKFVRNVGRDGAGPGEFSRGEKSVLFDGERRWYVPARGGLTVFSQSLEYQRTISSTGPSSNGDYMALLDDGTLIAPARGQGAGGMFFRLLGPVTGAAVEDLPVIRTFGPVDADGRGPPRGTLRRIAYGGGATFWAAVPDEAGWGYVLELWRTDGTRLRTIKRDTPWFPVGASAKGGPGALPSPEIEGVFDDGNGLLFVQTMVINKTWNDVARFANDPARKADVEKAIEIRVEVIDTKAGVVLASLGPLVPSRAMAAVPRVLFPRSRQGFRRDETADGYPIARIVEYRLVAQ
jgi:hypothetical protein